MIARDEALALVTERIPQRNLVNHCVATEIIMRALAERLGLADEDVERWALAGLLHDLDYAETADDPARHGLVTAEVLARRRRRRDDARDPRRTPTRSPRETPMDHALWCADPTTGFIVAAALVRPEKDIAGVAAQEPQEALEGEGVREGRLAASRWPAAPRSAWSATSSSRSRSPRCRPARPRSGSRPRNRTIYLHISVPVRILGSPYLVQGA